MRTRLSAQTHWIARAYQFTGLYSVPLLTIVTVISMCNVFTSGYFSQFPFIGGLWAFIFAASIDVNIVRLFLEAQIAKRQGHLKESRVAFWVGLGLACVTGVALLIEGLQQSIGLDWHDPTLRFIIGLLIFLRVVLVVVLMAREGGKLGQIILSFMEELVKQEAVFPPAITPEKMANEEESPPQKGAQESLMTDEIEAQNEHQNVPIEPEQKEYSDGLGGRRTMTIEEVINLSGLTERKVKNLLQKRVLKGSPRNKNLVLISSFEEWQKTNELPVKAVSFQQERSTSLAANGNGNGHHTTAVSELAIIAQARGE